MEQVIEEFVDPLLEKFADQLLMGNRMLLPVIGKEADPRVKCLDFNLDDSNLGTLPAISPKKKPVPSPRPAKILPLPSPLPAVACATPAPPDIRRNHSNDENV